jgi:hypothetical protein
MMPCRYLTDPYSSFKGQLGNLLLEVFTDLPLLLPTLSRLSLELTPCQSLYSSCLPLESHTWPSVAAQPIAVPSL